jgi:hypothetical protein
VQNAKQEHQKSAEILLSQIQTKQKNGETREEEQ